MRTVSLPGGERTTALGFGCSALVAGRTPAESVRLLDAAFDAGIRHFDVARVYGTGDAEAVVGRFAARRRDEITIATKFGIDPLPRSAGVNALKAVLRPAMRRSRALVGLVRRHASRTVTRGVFTPEHARSSLATSLQELGTDRVDLFLLHDCTAEEWQQPELHAALDQLRAEGRLRAFGSATTYAHTEVIVTGPGPKPQAAQFESDALDDHLPRFAASADGALPITYGSLRDALPRLRGHLEGNREEAARWSSAVGADVSDLRALPRLLLCAALEANRAGIVLFSSGSPERIADNVRLAADPPYSPQQLQAFTALASTLDG